MLLSLKVSMLRKPMQTSPEGELRKGVVEVIFSNELCNYQFLPGMNIACCFQRKYTLAHCWLAFIPRVQWVNRETAKLCPRNVKFLPPSETGHGGIRRFLEGSPSKTGIRVLCNVLAPGKHY